MTNTKLLNEVIKRSGIKKGVLAEKIGVSRTTFSALLRNRAEFKVDQALKLCEILGIDDARTKEAIFFAKDGA